MASTSSPVRLPRRTRICTWRMWSYLTRIGLALKASIEQLREQVQNIE